MNDGENEIRGETPSEYEIQSRPVQKQMESLARSSDFLRSPALRDIAEASRPFDSPLRNIIAASRPFDSPFRNIIATSRPFDSPFRNIIATSRPFDSPFRNIGEASRQFDSPLRNIHEAARRFDSVLSRDVVEAMKRFELGRSVDIHRTTRLFDSLQTSPSSLGVDDYVDVVSHPEIPIYVPTHHKKMSDKEMREILANIQSAGGRLVVCAGCGRLREVEELQLDHLFPREDGGEDWIGNRVLLCVACNNNKRHWFTISGLWRENRQRKNGRREWMEDEAAAKEIYNRVKDFQKSLLDA